MSSANLMQTLECPHPNLRKRISCLNATNFVYAIFVDTELDRHGYAPGMTRPTPIGVMRSPRPIEESNLFSMSGAHSYDIEVNEVGRNEWDATNCFPFLSGALSS
jgi:hypothetical protein